MASYHRLAAGLPNKRLGGTSLILKIFFKFDKKVEVDEPAAWVSLIN